MRIVHAKGAQSSENQAYFRTRCEKGRTTFSPDGSRTTTFLTFNPAIFSANDDITNSPTNDRVTCEKCIALVLAEVGEMEVTSTYRTPEENEKLATASKRTCCDGNPCRCAVPTFQFDLPGFIPHRDELHFLGTALIDLASLPHRFVNTPGRKWLKPMSHMEGVISHTGFPTMERHPDGSEKARCDCAECQTIEAPAFTHPRDRKDPLEDLEDLLAE